jgi:hypothetical protein
MGFWTIIQPVGTTNLVTNPSVEAATSGYTALNCTMTRSQDRARYGVSSLKCVTTAQALSGVNFQAGLSVGQAYTFSVDVRVQAGFTVRLEVLSPGLVSKATSSTASNGDWQRLSLTWTADANATFNWRVYVVESSSMTFYYDGFQLEALGFATTYCDGDQDGCIWLGAANLSTSSRNSRTRLGGREINLDTIGVMVRTHGGVGTPQMTHRVLQQALVPGGVFQGRRLISRMLILEITSIGTSWSDLHSRRKALLALVQPSTVNTEEPVLLRYYGSDSARPVEYRAYYDSGLEFGTTSGFSEDTEIRLICYDPLAYDIAYESVALTGTSQITPNMVMARINKVWQIMSSGVSATPKVITVGPDGNVYVGGGFTTAGGVTVNGIAKWDGTSWSALGSGVSGGGAIVNCLMFDAAGNLYAGGSFTTAGGVSCANIAKWNGSWSALGTGCNNAVYDMALSGNGNIWVVGSFTAPFNLVAIWTGAAWAAGGLGIVGSGVLYTILVFGNDLFAYAAGQVLDGATYKLVYRYQAAVWVNITQTSGVTGSSTITKLMIDKAGNLLAFGNWGSPSTPMSKKWLGGTSWTELDSKFRQSVKTAIIDLTNGKLLVGGDGQGGDQYGMLNAFTGTDFVRLGLVPNSPLACMCMAQRKSNGDLFIGMDTGGIVVNASNGVTITNQGSAEAFPIIYIKRSGGTSTKLYYIRNETSGKQITFNAVDLLDGEQVLLDLRPGMRSCISNVIGNAWKYLDRTSDTASFTLLPGANLITVEIVSAGSPTVEIAASWKTTFLSADGRAL